MSIHAADKYYDVAGTTSEQIIESLRAQAIAAGDDRESHAETRSQVGWSYEYHQAAAGSCRIARVHVELAIDTVLPRWRAAPTAAPQLKSQWARFAAATRVHEKGHYDLDVASANEVLAALRRMPQDDCARLKDDSDRLAKAVLDRYRELNAKYDADTKHGVLQGTVWRIERER